MYVLYGSSVSEQKRVCMRQAESSTLSSKENISVDLRETDCENLECIHPV
jgi:hypothetical protein